MNRMRIVHYVKNNMLRCSIAGLAVCLIGGGVGAMTISNNSRSIVDESPQAAQKKEPVTDKSMKNDPETSVSSSSETNHESNPPEPQVAVSSGAAAATPRTSAPLTPPSTPRTAPAVEEFGIAYLSLSSPAVFCSGGGEYYIAQIGDVNVGLRGNAGGQITYGFEVTGGIPDTWNGYRHSATVPAGVYSTSFNKLRWGNTTDPNMAYSEVIYSGHGVAAVRAVVYTPTLTYSPWATIPAQQHGEQCS